LDTLSSIGVLLGVTVAGFAVHIILCSGSYVSLMWVLRRQHASPRLRWARLSTHMTAYHPRCCAVRVRCRGLEMG
jgi:hypothetical protein